ncbi:MAG: chemotaxis-specific protein-glutamate methyltransferase CheB [Anaerolineae bacterium]|nr:chemotaxis-specific protein-glutamate methyltransferase CheB [Anaerolineae bacterium]
MADLPKTPIRLLVAEDSPVCRELLVTIFQNTPGVQVVGAARDGAEAVRLAKRLHPDVVAMDVFMPQLNGYEAVRQIMAEAPCPIVMVSGQLPQGRQEMTFQALQAGAVTIVPKPALDDGPEVTAELVKQVKLMAGVRVVRRPYTTPLTSPPAKMVKPNGRIHLLALVASTGGPGALAAVLGRLPADFPAPVVVVQHVARGFAADLAVWLNRQTALTVRLAQAGDALCPGYVLVAPDDHHLLVQGGGVVALLPPEKGDRYCPSADRLLVAVARVYGDTAVGVVLTGMGDDGAQGLAALRQTGAHTIAQDEATSLIFGMPASAIHQNAVEMVLPVDKIAERICDWVIE